MKIIEFITVVDERVARRCGVKFDRTVIDLLKYVVPRVIIVLIPLWIVVLNNNTN